MSKYFFNKIIILLLFPALIWSQERILTLAECIKLAMENNPELQMSKTDLESTRYKVREMNAKLKPKLNISAKYRHQSEVPEIDMGGKISLPFSIAIEPVQIGAFDQYETKLALTQPIYTGHRLRNAVRVSQAQANAESAQTNKIESELIFRVKSTYFKVLHAEKILQIAETAREQVKAHQRDVENFVAQGLARKNELLKAQVKFFEAELAVIQANNAVQLGLAALENIIGVKLEDRLKLENIEFGDMQEPELEESIKKAKSKRMELLMVSHNLEAAKHALSIVRGEKYPSVAAFGSYSYGKPGLDFVKNEWMDYWIVGVGAEWILWNWGETRSKIEQAQLNVTKLEYLQRQLNNVIELEVTQACLKMKEAMNRILVACEMVNQAQENYRVTENIYKQGQLKNTDFLDAQMDLTRAKIEKTRAEIDYALAKAEWEKTVGEISTDESVD